VITDDHMNELDFGLRLAGLEKDASVHRDEFSVCLARKIEIRECFMNCFGHHASTWSVGRYVPMESGDGQPSDADAFAFSFHEIQNCNSFAEAVALAAGEIVRTKIFTALNLLENKQKQNKGNI